MRVEASDQEWDDAIARCIEVACEFLPVTQHARFVLEIRGYRVSRVPSDPEGEWLVFEPGNSDSDAAGDALAAYDYVEDAVSHALMHAVDEEFNARLESRLERASSETAGDVE